MFTRSICGAMLALISYAAIPQSSSKNDLPIGDQVSGLQAELSQVVEQLSREQKANSLVDALESLQTRTLDQIEGLQHNQDRMLTTLDQVVASLRKSQSVKYVTKSDLDEAIATTKDSVEKVKASTPSGCDCECQSKIALLEARIVALEAKCVTPSLSSRYSTKSGGSTGSVTTQSYSVQSASHSGDSDVWLEALKRMPTQTYSSSKVVGGSTGSVQSTSYSTYAPQPTSIDLPNRTRTVKVVEPMTRRNVQFVEVSQNSDVDLTVQAAPSFQPSQSQCFTDANGNRACPQSTTMPVSMPAKTVPQKWTLGSRLRGK